MLSFEKQTIRARMVLPDGRTAEKPIEVRQNPITGRTCRIVFSRAEESEPGAAALPTPPPSQKTPPIARSARPRSPRTPRG